MNGIDLFDHVLPLLRSDDAFIRNASIDILSIQGENAIEPIRKLLVLPLHIAFFIPRIYITKG